MQGSHTQPKQCSGWEQLQLQFWADGQAAGGFAALWGQSPCPIPAEQQDLLIASWVLRAGGVFGVLWVHFVAVMEPSSEGLHGSCPCSLHLPFSYWHGKEASASPAPTALPLPPYVEEHPSLLSLPSSLSLGMKGNGAFVLRSN